MARILVLYGTTDGHTAKIARSIGDKLRARYAHVDVVEAGTTDPDPEAYAAVIVAASVQQTVTSQTLDVPLRRVS